MYKCKDVSEKCVALSNEIRHSVEIIHADYDPQMSQRSIQNVNSNDSSRSVICGRRNARYCRPSSGGKRQLADHYFFASNRKQRRSIGKHKRISMTWLLIWTTSDMGQSFRLVVYQVYYPKQFAMISSHTNINSN